MSVAMVTKKANSEPEFNDYPMSFPLEEYAQGVGFTGWDWVDTRITVIHVPTLSDEEEIYPAALRSKLKDETPPFLYTALNTELPMYKRLRLPIVDMIAKKCLQETRRPPVERFIEERCFRVPGTKIKFSDFSK